MLSINDLKKGVNISLNGEPFTVVSSQHIKMGRGGGMMQTKLKNLINGKVIEKNFKGQESIEPANLLRQKAQFLYADNEGVHFMEQENFETLTVPAENVGDLVQYLKEGQSVDLLSFNSNPINISMPVKVDLVVKNTPPGAKGNTATGGNKPATLESGATVNVPLFVKEGDTVRVNTETGEYVERVN